MLCWVAQTNSVSTPGPKQQVAKFLFLPDKGSRDTFRSGMCIEQKWDAGVRPVCVFGCVTYLVLTLIYRLTFMGLYIVNVFFKHNQQDATLYNILYYCQCCTCFRRFLRPSSGAQNCTHSIWYMSSLLATTASGTRCCVYSWWWAKKPPETCRALTVIRNIV
jgi:hypothetical protein